MRIDWRWPLLGAGSLGLLMSVRMAAAPLVRVSVPSTDRAATTAPGEALQRRVAPESVTAIVSRNPFRIGRRPVLPAYDPMRLAEQQAPPPARPALTVVGIVAGEEPSAVIEGLPGVEGSRVVRVGDLIGALRIKRMRDGRVEITGMDTTWILEVREPWKP